jgi:hypothetical protein
VPSCELTGVTFTVKPETEAGDFAEAEALTFVLTVDYAEAAPRLLKLTATVTDAKGKVVLEREETIADEQYRYRIKKILLDPLSPGDYVGRFKLSAEAGELTQEVQFSVRPPD